MEVSSKAGILSALEARPIPLATGHSNVLIGTGVPLTGAADLASSCLLSETIYAGTAALKLFSHIAGEPMEVSSKAGILSALEARPIPLATGYSNVLIGTGVPLTGDADLASSCLLSETIYVVLATIEPFSSGVVGEITQASQKEMVVSPLEPSPLLKLLVQLITLQYTSEDERWPDAIWPNAQAFADAQTFIRRLPLNVIPLPEISLADDGEVNFLWQSDGVHVDLGFYGTGTCSYFARGKDGRRIHGDDAPASEGLPSEIITLFTA